MVDLAMAMLVITRGYMVYVNILYKPKRSPINHLGDRTRRKRRWKPGKYGGGPCQFSQSGNGTANTETKKWI